MHPRLANSVTVTAQKSRAKCGRAELSCGGAFLRACHACFWNVRFGGRRGASRTFWVWNVVLPSARLAGVALSACCQNVGKCEGRNWRWIVAGAVLDELGRLVHLIVSISEAVIVFYLVHDDDDDDDDVVDVARSISDASGSFLWQAQYFVDLSNKVLKSRVKHRFAGLHSVHFLWCG